MSVVSNGANIKIFFMPKLDNQQSSLDQNVSDVSLNQFPGQMWVSYTNIFWFQIYFWAVKIFKLLSPCSLSEMIWQHLLWCCPAFHLTEAFTLFHHFLNNSKICQNFKGCCYAMLCFQVSLGASYTLKTYNVSLVVQTFPQCTSLWDPGYEELSTWSEPSDQGAFSQHFKHCQISRFTDSTLIHASKKVAQFREYEI